MAAAAAGHWATAARSSRNLRMLAASQRQSAASGTPLVATCLGGLSRGIKHTNAPQLPCMHASRVTHGMGNWVYQVGVAQYDGCGRAVSMNFRAMPSTLPASPMIRCIGPHSSTFPWRWVGVRRLGFCVEKACWLQRLHRWRSLIPASARSHQRISGQARGAACVGRALPPVSRTLELTMGLVRSYEWTWPLRMTSTWRRQLARERAAWVHVCVCG